MIRRADFAEQSQSQNTLELSQQVNIEQIAGNGPFVKLCRKPDFQRETNQWSPNQVSALIKSFAYGELIPSLILWKSDNYNFVIDGAHRLSALRAWTNDDYGDKGVSSAFFGGKLGDEQISKAKTTRRMVEREVGRYSHFHQAYMDDTTDDEIQSLASNIFSRSLHVQWIQGSQEVAESSFFKINSQGTALDKTEELLLRHRSKPHAIASRSVVRAATGHKYWSAFPTQQDEIEELAESLHGKLFSPELKEPIKTLDLPIGGTSSPVDALKMLVDIFAISENSLNPKKLLEAAEVDLDGTQTVKKLKQATKIIGRMTGNEAPSLGLHPAVYFYTERGAFSRFMFLGTLLALSKRVNNNDKKWFKKFTEVRADLENTLVDRKSVINQGLANVNSSTRIQKVCDLLDSLVHHYDTSNEAVTDQELLGFLGLKGNAGNLQIIDAPTGFTVDVKSAAYLQEAVQNAPNCRICGARMNIATSVSYDHINPKKSGGAGTQDNVAMTHPYCNTAIKN